MPWVAREQALDLVTPGDLLFGERRVRLRGARLAFRLRTAAWRDQRDIVRLGLETLMPEPVGSDDRAVGEMDAFPPLIVFGVIQTSVFGRIGGSYMKLAPVATEAVVVPRMRCPFSVSGQWPEYVTAEESSSMNCALTLLDPEIGLSDLRAAEHIRSGALETKLPGFEDVAPGGDAQGALDILFDDEERGAGVRYLAEHVQ